MGAAEELTSGDDMAQLDRTALQAPSPVEKDARPNSIHYAPTLSRGMTARGQESAMQQTTVMILAGGQGER